MKDLIERSYKAIKERGLIDDNTTISAFINKLREEFNEILIEYKKSFLITDSLIEELTDLITVGIMLMRHNNIDFIEQFEKVVIKNETRKD